MAARRPANAVLLAMAGVALVVMLAAAAGAYVWREEILRTALDPKQPYQTYRPPPAPDYLKPGAWALLPSPPSTPPIPAVDVFFVHPTSYDGGRDWNAPIGQRQADRFLFRVLLPNYAGPFHRAGPGVRAALPPGQPLQPRSPCARTPATPAASPTATCGRAFARLPDACYAARPAPASSPASGRARSSRRSARRRTP